MPEKPPEWNNYRIHVLHELKRLSEHAESISRDVRDIRVKDIPAVRESVSALTVKASIWGGAGGILAVIAASLMRLL